jgi:ribonuclease D
MESGKGRFLSRTPELPEEYTRAIGSEEINALPLRRFEGEIYLVRTEGQRKAAIKRLRAERVLGFDTETRPTFRKGQPQHPPALVQLAGSDCVYLFQISLLPFSDGLLDLLADVALLKAGVSVRDDLKGLKSLAPFEEAGFLDLGEVARTLKMQTHGLRGLAANLLGFRISKGAQCTNWARTNLSAQQIAYAATDAWVSREIYLAMQRLGVV